MRSIILGGCYLLLVAVLGISLGVAADVPAKKNGKNGKNGAAKAASPSDKSDKTDKSSDIRAGSQAFAAAFNKRDAKAIAAMWTPDGDYVDDAGRKFSGREEIEKGYTQFFAANPKAQIRVLVDSVKFLSDAAAVEEGHATVEPAPAGSPGVSTYSAIHVKMDGKWLMASVRDRWSDTPSAYTKVADLEWLIGTWTAEENGAKTESICRWVANKSFVERKYTLTHTAGDTISGVQIIGWNPQLARVQSWNFTSDGGHAVGFWTPRENGWASETVGMTADGTATTSVNVLRKLDENAYVWQSTQRTVDGRSIPDTDEVVLKRSANAK